jgi:hypothetical protein
MRFLHFVLRGVLFAHRIFFVHYGDNAGGPQKVPGFEGNFDQFSDFFLFKITRNFFGNVD